jgi:hypothetical protein
LGAGTGLARFPEPRKKTGGDEMLKAISHGFQAGLLFLFIVLGWIGDSLLSFLIGRPRLSFQEVYRSWKQHNLLCP